MLGLSDNPGDADIDPSRLADGAGVANGRLLVDFVNALSIGGDELAEQRAIVTSALGLPAMIDAVGVFANFSMMTRIADGTGTPLDDGTMAMTTDLRTALGIEDLTSRRLGKSVGKRVGT